MLIGLISEPKPYTRKILIKRLFGMDCTDKIENLSNPFKTMVAIVPYPLKKLEKMSHKKLKRKIERQKIRLNSCGVDRIVYSKAIKKHCKDKGVWVENKKEIENKHLFLKLAPACIRDTSKKCGIDLMRASVCIRDTKMDRISEYLMKELCFDIKTLTIATQNKKYADEICERFYDETGLLIKAVDLSCSNGDVVIDVDLSQIKIGNDLYVRQAELGFDFGKYNINHTEVVTDISKIDFDKIKWLYSYDC